MPKRFVRLAGSQLLHHLEDLHLLGLALNPGGGVLPDLELRAQPFRAGRAARICRPLASPEKREAVLTFPR